MYAYKNTPAFPVLEGSTQWHGMNMHDYFMAHAPAEPQKWFNPVMPPCPVVPSLQGCSTQLRHEIIGCDAGDETPAAIEWLAERDRLTVLQSEWQAEFRKQLYIQWPAAWADAMLEQRKC